MEIIFLNLQYFTEYPLENLKYPSLFYYNFNMF